MCVQMVSHLMACTWMFMGLVYLSWFDDFDNTWLSTAQIDLVADSLASKYIQCLYFSITIMATVGACSRLERQSSSPWETASSGSSTAVASVPCGAWSMQ